MPPSFFAFKRSFQFLVGKVVSVYVVASDDPKLSRDVVIMHGTYIPTRGIWIAVECEVPDGWMAGPWAVDLAYSSAPRTCPYCIPVAGQAAYGMWVQSVLLGIMGGFIAMGIQSAQPSLDGSYVKVAFRVFVNGIDSMRSLFFLCMVGLHKVLGH